MTWGLAQAGNRASKTGRYLQWWENRPEWGAMTSAVRNSRNSAHFSSVLSPTKSQSRLHPVPRPRLLRQGGIDKKLFTLLDLCVSSLRRGHANLLCIVPILTDDHRRGSMMMMMTFDFCDGMGAPLPKKGRERERERTGDGDDDGDDDDAFYHFYMSSPHVS